jgi:hypothetical protein
MEIAFSGYGEDLSQSQTQNGRLQASGGSVKAKVWQVVTYFELLENKMHPSQRALMDVVEQLDERHPS